MILLTIEQVEALRRSGSPWFISIPENLPERDAADDEAFTAELLAAITPGAAAVIPKGT